MNIWLKLPSGGKASAGVDRSGIHPPSSTAHPHAKEHVNYASLKYILK